MLRDAAGEMQASGVKDRRAGRPAHLRQPAVRHAGQDLQPDSSWSPEGESVSSERRCFPPRKSQSVKFHSRKQKNNNSSQTSRCEPKQLCGASVDQSCNFHCLVSPLPGGGGHQHRRNVSDHRRHHLRHRPRLLQTEELQRAHRHGVAHRHALLQGTGSSALLNV